MLATLQGHTGEVLGVALSAEGRLLASGSDDATVRLWGAPFAELVDDELSAGPTTDFGPSMTAPASGGRLLATFQGHTGTVWGVALSADAQLLASCSEDATVRLWEVNSRACLRILRSDRCYERVDITALTGVTAAQRGALLSLGAVEHQEAASTTNPGISRYQAP